MSRGFVFKEPVDPWNPLEPSDPPPTGWYNNIDTQDYRHALFGVPSPLFERCREWEDRELARITARKKIPRSASAKCT